MSFDKCMHSWNLQHNHDMKHFYHPPKMPIVSSLPATAYPICFLSQQFCLSQNVSYSIKCFVSGSFHLAIKGSEHTVSWMNLKCVMLSGTVLEEYTNICVSVHLLMSLWVFSTLGLLEIQMIGLLACKFCGDMYFNFSQVNTQKWNSWVMCYVCVYP